MAGRVGCVAVMAVALVAAATGCSGPSSSTGSPSSHSSAPAGSPTASATGRATPAPASLRADLHGLVLGLDRAGRFVRAEAGQVGGAARLALRSIPGGPSLIAPVPGAGWVVTHTPARRPRYGAAPTRLAMVDPAGRITAFGPVYPPDTAVTALAVDPAGHRVALGLMSWGRAAGPARIIVRSLPGRPGTAREWVLDDAEANQVASLSWAPDGRRLTYLAGTQTGGGLTANPATLDTALTGRLAPTRSRWTPAEPCLARGAEGVAWLGKTGLIGVVATCADNTTFAAVDPETWATAGPRVDLPGEGCLASYIHPLTDGSRILIARCGHVQLVAGARVTAAAAALRDAAWSGTTSAPPPGATSPVALRPGDPAVYGPALWAVQAYLDRVRGAGSQQLVAGRVVAYLPDRWSSPRAFRLLVTLELRFVAGYTSAWNDGLNERFITFTRPLRSARFRLELASSR